MTSSLAPEVCTERRRQQLLIELLFQSPVQHSEISWQQHTQKRFLTHPYKHCFKLRKRHNDWFLCTLRQGEQLPVNLQWVSVSLLVCEIGTGVSIFFFSYLYLKWIFKKKWRFCVALTWYPTRLPRVHFRCVATYWAILVAPILRGWVTTMLQKLFFSL